MGFVGFGIATTSALLQILGILSWRKQEERKSRNQDFKAAPAWSISSEQMESGSPALPGFKCWRAAANSFCEKLSEIFTALVLWPSKGQTLLDRQVEMTCNQQPHISHF